MQWGLVGEAIDYNEMVTGKRTEGSIYGTFNLTRRIGQTVGNSAAVLALGWIGYQAGAATQTSPSRAAAFARRKRPGEAMPSSLATSMLRRLFIFYILLCRPQNAFSVDYNL